VEGTDLGEIAQRTSSQFGRLSATVDGLGGQPKLYAVSEIEGETHSPLTGWWKVAFSLGLLRRGKKKLQKKDNTRVGKFIVRKKGKTHNWKIGGLCPQK